MKWIVVKKKHRAHFFDMSGTVDGKSFVAGSALCGRRSGGAGVENSLAARCGICERLLKSKTEQKALNTDC